MGNRISMIIGELSDADAIDRAVAGAVVSALGPSLDRKAADMPLIEGTRNILDAMKRHGVTRYIGHATPSILDPHEKPTWQTRLVGFMGRTGLPRAYQELIGITDLIRNAGVNWTIVRFTAPNNKPNNGKLRVGFYGTDRIGFAVSRADIAAFTARQVDDNSYLNRAPAIIN
jgi:hypothetical protein